MSEDFYKKVDDAQKKVDVLDAVEDNKVEVEGKSYGEVFLDKVDQFQEFIKKSEVPDKLKQEQLSQLGDFLLGVDLSQPNRLDSLKTELEGTLTAFRGELDKLEGGLKARHHVVSGDTLGKLVEAVMHVKWNEDPVRFFAGVRFLQEKRNTEGSLLNFKDGKVDWTSGSTDPNSLKIGEYLVTEGLESVQGTPADVEWYLSFPGSKNYESALRRALAKRGEVADGVRSDQVSSTGGVVASTDVIDATLGETSVDADAVAPAEAKSASEVDPAVRSQAEAIAEAQQQEALRMQQETFVQEFINDLKNERDVLRAKVNEMREDQTGWSGYGHAIEPSNLVSSLGGGVRRMFGGEAMASTDMIGLELTQDYAQLQEASLGGMYALLKMMRGSQRAGNETAPMLLGDAWTALESGGDADFSAFQGSPEGVYFKAMFVEKQMLDEAARNDLMAKMYYDKGMEVMGRVGKREAQPYFQSVIASFPSSQWASKAQSNLLSTAEKAGHVVTEVGDCLLRLDMLALMVGSAGAGGLMKGGALATRIAELTTQFPRAAKLFPGLKLLEAGKDATALARVGVGTVNFAFEVGKFMAIVEGTRKVAGDKAAYAAMSLCFFMPGIVHGFERVAGQSVETAVAERGPDALKQLGELALAEAGGSPEVLREVIVVGMEQQARATGEAASREIMVRQADDVLGELGIQVRTATQESTAVAERAVTDEVTSVAAELARPRSELLGLSEAQMRVLESGFDDISIDFSLRSEAWKALVDVMRIDVTKIPSAVMRGLSSAGRFSVEKFMQQWQALNSKLPALKQFFAEDWAATKQISGATIKDLRDAFTQLGRLFLELPSGVKRFFVRDMARLESSIAVLDDAVAGVERAGGERAKQGAQVVEEVVSGGKRGVKPVIESTERSLIGEGERVVESVVESKSEQFIQLLKKGDDVFLESPDGKIVKFFISDIRKDGGLILGRVGSKGKHTWELVVEGGEFGFRKGRAAAGEYKTSFFRFKGAQRGSQEISFASFMSEKGAAEGVGMKGAEALADDISSVFSEEVRRAGMPVAEYLENLSGLEFGASQEMIASHGQSIAYLRSLLESGELSGLDMTKFSAMAFPEGHPLLALLERSTTEVERRAVLSEMVSYLEIAVEHMNSKEVIYAQLARVSSQSLTLIEDLTVSELHSRISGYRSLIDTYGQNMKNPSIEFFGLPQTYLPREHGLAFRKLFFEAQNNVERKLLLEKAIIPNMESQIRLMEERLVSLSAKAERVASSFQNLSSDLIATGTSEEVLERLMSVGESELHNRYSLLFTSSELDSMIATPQGAAEIRTMCQEILGVGTDASLAQVRTRYRQLLRLVHPDFFDHNRLNRVISLAEKTTLDRYGKLLSAAFKAFKSIESSASRAA